MLRMSTKKTGYYTFDVRSKLTKSNYCLEGHVPRPFGIIIRLGEGETLQPATRDHVFASQPRGGGDRGQGPPQTHESKPKFCISQGGRGELTPCTRSSLPVWHIQNRQGANLCFCISRKGWRGPPTCATQYQGFVSPAGRWQELWTAC